jgi:predicted nucleotidyltransferase
VGCGHQVNPTTAGSNASNAGDVREATASDSKQNTEQPASSADNLQAGDGPRNSQTPYPHAIGRHPLAEARGPLPIFSSTTRDRPNNDEQISTCIEAITSFDAFAMLKTHQYLTDIAKTSPDLMRKKQFKSDEILVFAIRVERNCENFNKCK